MSRGVKDILLFLGLEFLELGNLYAATHHKRAALKQVERLYLSLSAQKRKVLNSKHQGWVLRTSETFNMVKYALNTQDAYNTVLSNFVSADF